MGRDIYNDNNNKNTVSYTFANICTFTLLSGFLFVGCERCLKERLIHNPHTTWVVKTVVYRCVKILVYRQDQPEQLASLHEFARVLTDRNNADKCAAVCTLCCPISCTESVQGLSALLFKHQYLYFHFHTKQDRIPTLTYKRKIEEHSCNHCNSRKAISTTYSGYVFLALGIQHAMRMRHIFIRGLPGSTIFFHIISKKQNFRKKVIEHKICFLILSTTFFF